jgi:opacity protein-like surface antigen
MKKRLSMTIAALALAIAPSAAWADGYFVPFIGANFGGDVGRPLSETVDDRNRFTFGFGVGGMAGGIFGAEFDFGYTNNFYANDGSVVTKSNLITAMPALVIGIPVGGQSGPGIRPYVLAGAGLLRRDLDFDTLDTVSRNDWGYTLGGGVMGYFSDRVGLRADLRYFRNFEVDDFDLDDIDVEEGTFNFGRASIGVLFRF